MSELDRNYTGIDPSGYQYTRDPKNSVPFWEDGGDPSPVGEYVKSCGADIVQVGENTRYDFYYIDKDGDKHTYTSITPGSGGGGGGTGYTYTPHITEIAGGYVLSWTNDGGLPNPDPVTITDGKDGKDGATGPQGPQGEKGETGATGPQGPQGEKGETGATGPQGETGPAGEKGADGAAGVTFTPTITTDTTASPTAYTMTWTNDGDKDNPEPVTWHDGEPGESGNWISAGVTLTPYSYPADTQSPGNYSRWWAHYCCYLVVDGAGTSPATSWGPSSAMIPIQIPLAQKTYNFTIPVYSSVTGKEYRLLVQVSPTNSSTGLASPSVSVYVYKRSDDTDTPKITCSLRRAAAYCYSYGYRSSSAKTLKITNGGQFSSVDLDLYKVAVPGAHEYGPGEATVTTSDGTIYKIVGIGEDDIAGQFSTDIVFLDPWRKFSNSDTESLRASITLRGYIFLDGETCPAVLFMKNSNSKYIGVQNKDSRLVYYKDSTENSVSLDGATIETTYAAYQVTTAFSI